MNHCAYELTKLFFYVKCIHTEGTDTLCAFWTCSSKFISETVKKMFILLAEKCLLCVRMTVLIYPLCQHVIVDDDCLIQQKLFKKIK